MREPIIWISGASSGIGRALALTAPWPGARCINLSRRPLDGFPHVPVDLATADGIARAARSFEEELAAFSGELAVFVHSAGTLNPIGFAGEVDGAAYAQAVALGSWSPQVLGDAFLRALWRGPNTRVRGLIVMITSGAASNPYEGWSAYGAGKAAMDQWVRTVGCEQDMRGGRCRVIAIAPGVVETAMQEEIRSTAAKDFPAVAKFVEIFESGNLRVPEIAAKEIWQLAADESLANGSILDLRR